MKDKQYMKGVTPLTLFILYLSAFALGMLVMACIFSQVWR